MVSANFRKWIIYWYPWLLLDAPDYQLNIKKLFFSQKIGRHPVALIDYMHSKLLIISEKICVNTLDFLLNIICSYTAKAICDRKWVDSGPQIDLKLPRKIESTLQRKGICEKNFEYIYQLNLFYTFQIAFQLHPLLK